MIIEYEGREYSFDSDDLTVKQALKIEKHIGGPMLEWEKGMTTGRADCYQALGWLIFHAGDQTPIDSVDFKFGKLARAFEAASAKEVAAAAAAAAAEAEADPTVAAASNGRTHVPA